LHDHPIIKTAGPLSALAFKLREPHRVSPRGEL
jgi:hypothetical protein